MSVVTVEPGALIVFDPSDKRGILFDFDTNQDGTANLPVGVTLSSYVLTITPIQQYGVTALTADNAGLTGGDRMVRARFLATTATLGDCYRVSVKGTTSENPVQVYESSIDILIQDH